MVRLWDLYQQNKTKDTGLGRVTHPPHEEGVIYICYSYIISSLPSPRPSPRYQPVLLKRNLIACANLKATQKENNHLARHGTCISLGQNAGDVRGGGREDGGAAGGGEEGGGEDGVHDRAGRCLGLFNRMVRL